MNRATGDAVADGDVKSTYSELKEQPNGALLASSSPIHVTARSMTARNNPGVALYSGKCGSGRTRTSSRRLPIQFDRDRRFVIGPGNSRAAGSDDSGRKRRSLKPERTKR